MSCATEKETEMENKQKILDTLLIPLRETRALSDLYKLEYDSDREVVIATFEKGYTKEANVAMDSGIAMIRDVLAQIV